jgi:SAM-dependent methyltransferase
MMIVSEIATNLTMLEEGIWISRNASQNISYPKDGNSACLTIEEQSFWFKHRNECLIEVFKRFPPEGTIFDLGGGNGYVSLALKNSGFDAIVVEPGIEGARNARQRGLHPVICSTLEDAGFKERAIPAMGMFDVLEHIEDDVGFLRKIRSLLKKDGRLYLAVPAHRILWSIEDDFAGHYRRYALNDLNEKLESVGYEIDYATYFFSLLPLPIFLLRTLPGKIGFRKKSTLQRNQKEHHAKQGLLGHLLDWQLSKELSRIRNGKIGFGASCLVVARARD